MKPTTLLPIFTLCTTLFLYSLLPNTDTTPTHPDPQPQLQSLIPGTYLNEYDPDTTDWQGASVLCSVDNVTPPITGSLMMFSLVSSRILIERPTHPNYEDVPDTYVYPGDCVVL